MLSLLEACRSNSCCWNLSTHESCIMRLAPKYRVALFTVCLSHVPPCVHRMHLAVAEGTYRKASPLAVAVIISSKGIEG